MTQSYSYQLIENLILQLTHIYSKSRVLTVIIQKLCIQTMKIE